MKNQLFFIVVSTILIGCTKDNGNSFKGFTPISEESTYDSLQVQGKYDYFEIRNNYCFNLKIYDILYSAGIKPSADSVFSNADEGVFYSHGDICMFINILIYDGTEYYFLKSYSEILDFFGPIDCKADALMLAYINGYFFEYNDKEFGIKEDSDYFLLYAYELVSSCSPIELDRFLLKIDIHGNIQILKQAVVQKIPGCA
jgi:hypothetical protein